MSLLMKLVLGIHVSVADANLIDSYTTGAITGTILETDSTTLSTLNSDTDNANAYTITVTGTADAGDLVTLETKTSVKVTMTGLTTVTGTLAEAEALFTLHNDEKVKLTLDPHLHCTYFKRYQCLCCSCKYTFCANKWNCYCYYL